MSSPQFISLKKSDPLFNSYLMGTAQNGLRPIPFKSLNVGQHDELVTFEMKSTTEIKKPTVFVQIAQLMKIKSYSLILFPLFFVIAKNSAANQLSDPLSLAFAAASLILIYGGLNMRNDVADHISGYDRVNMSLAGKPILAGWITAAKLSRASWVILSAGAVLALPVILLQFEIWKIVAVASPLLIAGQFLKTNSYKDKWFGELVLFFLMGVGVAAGFQVASGAVLDAEIISFGIFWGSIVLFLVHVNNFSHVLSSTQAGIQNSITKLGFDNSKIFLASWWGLCLVLWAVFHAVFATGIWMWLGTLCLLAAAIPLLRMLHRARSPVGSDLIKIRLLANTQVQVMLFLFFIEKIWSLVGLQNL